MTERKDIFGQTLVVGDEIVCVVRGRLERARVADTHVGCHLDMLSVQSLDGRERVAIPNWNAAKIPTQT